MSIIRWDTDSTDGVPEKVEILSPDGRYTQEFLPVHHLPYSLCRGRCVSDLLQLCLNRRQRTCPISFMTRRRDMACTGI